MSILPRFVVHLTLPYPLPSSLLPLARREQNVSNNNQDCPAVCSSFENVGWQSNANRNRFPSQFVAARASSSWTAWKGSYPGALEFITGNGTHCTMVYFNKAPPAVSASPTSFERFERGHKTNGEFVLAEAMRWLSKHDQKKWVGDTVPVHDALTYTWG